MQTKSFLFAVLAASGTASAQSPEARAQQIEHSIKRVVLVADATDSAFSIAERMKYWHVPGISIAIVDDFRIVYARGFGVT